MARGGSRGGRKAAAWRILLAWGALALGTATTAADHCVLKQDGFPALLAADHGRLREFRLVSGDPRVHVASVPFDRLFSLRCPSCVPAARHAVVRFGAAHELASKGAAGDTRAPGDAWVYGYAPHGLRATPTGEIWPLRFAGLEGALAVYTAGWPPPSRGDFSIFSLTNGCVTASGAVLSAAPDFWTLAASSNLRFEDARPLLEAIRLIEVPIGSTTGAAHELLEPLRRPPWRRVPPQVSLVEVMTPRLPNRPPRVTPYTAAYIRRALGTDK